MRLIDADELMTRLKFNSWDIDEWAQSFDERQAGLTANAIDIESVEDQPTIDAVPVIRCKDCRKNETMDCPMRYEYNHNVKVWYNSKADFCSWGERKEDD